MQRKAGCANLAQKAPDSNKCANGVQLLSYIEKERRISRFNALLLVHLQGLEPWAH